MWTTCPKCKFSFPIAPKGISETLRGIQQSMTAMMKRLEENMDVAGMVELSEAVLGCLPEWLPFFKDTYDEITDHKDEVIQDGKCYMEIMNEYRRKMDAESKSLA